MREDLKAYIDGALSESQAKVIETEIQANPVLAEEVRQLRLMSEILSAEVAEPTVLGFGATMAALNRGKKKRRAAFRLLYGAGGFAVAACAVVVALNLPHGSADEAATAGKVASPSVEVASASAAKSPGASGDFMAFKNMNKGRTAAPPGGGGGGRSGSGSGSVYDRDQMKAGPTLAVPSKITSLAVNVPSVEAAKVAINSAVSEAKGKLVATSKVDHDRVMLSVSIPESEVEDFVRKVKEQGTRPTVAFANPVNETATATAKAVKKEVQKQVGSDARTARQQQDLAATKKVPRKTNVTIQIILSPSGAAAMGKAPER